VILKGLFIRPVGAQTPSNLVPDSKLNFYIPQPAAWYTSRMENELEITAVSPLWYTVSTNEIPPEYLLLAILGIVASHLEVPPNSFTILSLWVTGIPVIIDHLGSDGPDGPSPPLDTPAKAA